MSIQYQNTRTGIILPRVHHIGYNSKPDENEITSEINKTLYSNSIESSLKNNDSFLTAGKISLNKSRVRGLSREISVEKSLNALRKSLLTEQFQMPNLGKFLAGDFSFNSTLLRKYPDKVTTNELLLTKPSFEIYSVYYNGTKGSILKIKTKGSKIIEKLDVSHNINNNNTSDKISVKKSDLFLEADTATTFSLQEENLVQSSNATPTVRDNIYYDLSAKLNSYTTDMWKSLLKKMNSEGQMSERVYDYLKKFDRNPSIDTLLFVPSTDFSVNYINTLFALLIKDINSDTYFSNNSLNPLNFTYTISEYLINKVYYAIKGEGYDFGLEDILIHKKIDSNTNNYKRYNNINDLESFLKDGNLKDNFCYKNFGDEADDIRPSPNWQNDPNYNANAREIYKVAIGDKNSITDRNKKRYDYKYLLNIFNHASYVGYDFIDASSSTGKIDGFDGEFYKLTFNRSLNLKNLEV